MHHVRLLILHCIMCTALPCCTQYFTYSCYKCNVFTYPIAATHMYWHHIWQQHTHIHSHLAVTYLIGKSPCWHVFGMSEVGEPGRRGPTKTWEGTCTETPQRQSLGFNPGPWSSEVTSLIQ